MAIEHGAEYRLSHGIPSGSHEVRTNSGVLVAFPRDDLLPAVRGLVVPGGHLVADHRGRVEVEEGGLSGFGSVQPPVQFDFDPSGGPVPVLPRFGALEADEVRPGRVEMAVPLFSSIGQRANA